MKRRTTLLGLIAILVLALIPLAGQTIQTKYIGTVNNIGNWQVKANKSPWLPAVQVINPHENNGAIGHNDWAIGLSSDGSSTGLLRSNQFNPAGWNGVWYARTSFDIPAWANYAILVVKPIVRQQVDCCGRYIYASDDRVVLAWNNYFGLTSATVGWNLTQKDNPLDVPGVQNSAELGKNNLPYMFSNRSQMYVLDQSAFQVGTNYIYLTINNTGSYMTGDKTHGYRADADSTPWTTTTDNTFVGVDIWVIYGDKSQFPPPVPSN